MQEIDETFSPLPIFKVEHQGQEVFGLDLLDEIGNAIYEDVNPAQVFHNEKPFEVIDMKDAYLIKLKLQFINDDDIEVDKYGDELIVTVGGRRKSVILPRFSNFLTLEKHYFSKPWLTIRLKKS